VAAARETGGILTLEQHSVLGGLGGAVAEVLAEAPLDRRVPFRRIGLPSAFSPRVGSQQYLEAQNGLDEASIVRAAETLLRR
jgi:transketolase